MPNNELIPPYTPLWQGDAECNKCDVIIIPQNAEFQFALPITENPETSQYIVTIDYNDISYDWNVSVTEMDGYVIAGIRWTFDFLQANLGTTLDLLDVAGGCYNIRLRLRTQLGDRIFEYTELGNIGQVYFPTESECNDNYLQLRYRLFCDQADDFIFYLDGALARQPLTLADELNAITSTGLSRRIFSRTQQTKELRLQPLTLATHELLEYVLNLPSFEIDNLPYTQAEGEVYTYVDAGTSGYYTGRVALVSGGNVFRSCCEDVLPSS